MHIVHGPKGGTSVPKAVGHCVRVRARDCRMRGTSLGAKTTGQKTGFFLFVFFANFFLLFFFFRTICFNLFFSSATFFARYM